VVANYLGSTHDVNPWNITFEPGDVNQGRRHCTMMWAYHVSLLLAPPSLSPPQEQQHALEWVHTGSRWPRAPHGVVVPICDCALHIPRCRAYCGDIPDHILERVHTKDVIVAEAKRQSDDLRRRKRLADEGKKKSDNKKEKKYKK
jgi:hypothetical protein